MAAARDSVRYWAGAVGAAAMVAGIVSVVVMVQMQKPTKTTKTATPSRTAAAPQSRPGTPPAWTMTAAQQKNPAAAPRAEAPAQPRAEAASQPRTVASVQTTPKAQPDPKAVPAAATLTDAERKLSEELWVEQKRLDTDSTKVTARPDGRARITTVLAKQYNVQE